ncbi:MAG: DUF4249 domain-containing protein [Cyclobacteriaceae bacterium]|nr:DUF4249 domain-containing protein [Cyclobacteriaceae bacterium]
MKNKLYIIFAFSLVACASLEEPPNSLVVEAYIYENKPVENIKITLVNPINSATDEIPVSNVEVYFKTNNTSYKLTESNTAGYYNLDFDIPIISGKRYELLVLYNDIEMVGETTIPKPVTGLLSSKDTLILTSPNDFINVSWDGTPDEWYLGVIQGNDPENTDFPFNNFFSIPAQKSTIKITPNDVQSVGIQQLILYGITKEYEDLYRISTSTIGSSNAGNMTNGFGVFTGFSSDTLTFVASEN